MRTTNESLKFYLRMVNGGNNTIYLQQENGTNNIKTTKGNELIFSGTKKEVYRFLVGIHRIMCLYDQYNQRQKTKYRTEIDLEDLIDD